MTTSSTEIVWQDVARQPVLVTGASIDPIQVEEIKEHLRIDIADEDGLIREYITAATGMVERDAQIALLTSTYALYLDDFPDWTVELRKPPVQSITSIAYLDFDGTSQTLSASNYRLDGKSRPARLTPAYGLLWPETYPVTNSVTITFVAGETTREAVSQIAKQAIRLLVCHWYRNREAVMTTGAVPQEISLAYAACIDRLSWSGQL